MLHIHLDPLGGVAGDMFAAAMMDAFPQHRDRAISAAARLARVACRIVPHDDGTLTGLRFKVAAEDGRHRHDHADWRTIRDLIAGADLAEEVKEHALGIFGTLAEAEAAVHGTTPDDVTFHEVGAADSIADIVAAASLITDIGATSWSVGALPLGGGRVETAHGPMPVPAPATTRLLQGFETIDDGIPGERVTPTGAAILRYLPRRPRPPGVLRQSGTGFGTRRLNGISNCLRALVLETSDQAASAATPHRRLGVISFEIDDQSGEDLAAGLDRLRTQSGVHDVVQMPAIGKKGRFAVHVQVLAAPDALDAVIEACFRETTTIGLRTHIVEGRALQRRFADVTVGERDVRVKLVERPGGLTGKAESDHMLALEGHAARTRLRREAERMAETL
jgi:uncharacterized protein (TIGR00299 family) protein